VIIVFENLGFISTIGRNFFSFSNPEQKKISRVWSVINSNGPTANEKKECDGSVKINHATPGVSTPMKK
jgi:hypothetical protein